MQNVCLSVCENTQILHFSACHNKSETMKGLQCYTLLKVWLLFSSLASENRGLIFLANSTYFLFIFYTWTFSKLELGIYTGMLWSGLGLAGTVVKMNKSDLPI